MNDFITADELTNIINHLNTIITEDDATEEDGDYLGE